MSLVTKVLVGRMALSHVGVSSNLESLDEKTPEARQLRTWEQQARRQTLEAFNWNFARKRINLATHAEAPPDGEWACRYQYPALALKIRKIQPPGGMNLPLSIYEEDFTSHQKILQAPPFTVELASDNSKSILTNVSSAIAIYTSDIEDLDLWTPLATLALSHAWASYIALPLTRGRDDMATKQTLLFARVIEAAQGHDGNEQVEPPPPDPSWIRGRQ